MQLLNPISCNNRRYPINHPLYYIFMVICNVCPPIVYARYHRAAISHRNMLTGWIYCWTKYRFFTVSISLTSVWGFLTGTAPQAVRGGTLLMMLLIFPLVWRLCTVATISPKTSLLNITTDEWELCSLPRTNGGKHTSWLTPTVPVRTMPLKFPQSTEASWQLPSLFRRMGLDRHHDLYVNLEGEHWSL